MAKDILKLLQVLEKSHDYYGKAKDLTDHVSKIRKAADYSYGDTEKLKDLAGLDNKDVQKLIVKLNKRTAATNAAASAQFPEIPSTTGEAFWRVGAAGDKHGKDSPQVAKEKKAYIKALNKYDFLLRERIAYCDVIIKHSTAQKKIYSGLQSVMDTSYVILERLLKLPQIKAASHHEACFTMYVKYRGLGSSGRDLAKAHERLVAKARAHKKDVEKLKKTNDVWIKDMAKAELTKMAESALKAIGF